MGFAINARPFLIIKLIQFVLGLICFGLFFGYLIGDGGAAVRYHIMVVSVVAYPFVIVPSIIASYIFEPDIERSLISILLSFGGFLVSIVAGICALTYSADGAKAAGVFAIVMSIMFLADVVLYALGKFKK